MESYRKASKLLEQTRDELLDILKENDMLSIRVRTSFNQLIGQFSVLTGTRGSEGKRTVFPEQTEFMGEPIKAPVEVKTEDLSPKELERKLFTEKVDRLESAIKQNLITNEQILESHPQQKDQLVIRGVAKRAGLEDYREAVINSEFIDTIRLGFAAQEEFETKVKSQMQQIDTKD